MSFPVLLHVKSISPACAKWDKMHFSVEYDTTLIYINIKLDLRILSNEALSRIHMPRCENCIYRLNLSIIYISKNLTFVMWSTVPLQESNIFLVKLYLLRFLRVCHIYNFYVMWQFNGHFEKRKSDSTSICISKKYLW